MTAEQFSDAIASVTGVGLPADPKFELLPVASHQPQPGGRTVFAQADALTTALGRPNREQVVTRRVETPTTLQALELANGGVLTGRLARGSAMIVEAGFRTPDTVARVVFTRALGREPSAQEVRLARDLLGPAPTPDTIQDLLWAVAMLPEFQLIH
jgi:hypothetical protein